MRDTTNYLEKRDVDRMLEAASVTSQRDYLMLRTLWITGMRVNELRHIRPSDIEPHNMVVNIIKAKGGKQSRVPLDEETISQLETYATEKGIAPHVPIFPRSKQWIRTLVHRYDLMIGREDVQSHTFRHSFAILIVKTGTDIRRVVLLLGHSSMSTTAVYLQFNDCNLEDAYAKLPF